MIEKPTKTHQEKYLKQKMKKNGVTYEGNLENTELIKQKKYKKKKKRKQITIIKKKQITIIKKKQITIIKKKTNKNNLKNQLKKIGKKNQSEVK